MLIISNGASVPCVSPVSGDSETPDMTTFATRVPTVPTFPEGIYIYGRGHIPKGYTLAKNIIYVNQWGRGDRNPEIIDIHALQRFLQWGHLLGTAVTGGYLCN